MLEERWQSLTAAQVSERLKSGDFQKAENSGLVRLDDLCVLNFQGTDVRKFLQGYLTCDTSSLDPEQLRPAALCNLKGRVIAFGWCLAPEAEQILWLIPADLVSLLQQFLKPYLSFSKTRLSMLADDHLLIGRVHADDGGNIASGLSVELVTSVEQLEMLGTNSVPLSRAAFDIRLIEASIPWISAATSQEFLPQMLDLVTLGAISFDKGCYLGQEVVARAQHRGQVKRGLIKLHQPAGQRATPGSTVIDNQGRSVGTIIQSASSDTVAVTLAVLQNDAQGPFQEQDTGLGLLS